ncbi:G5 and 3D domain-containing protein [Bacillus sp. V5-8f]|uniref:G5 and 3D domain-containing protein n=1 Tax=Bacillus sp. V5-8f TaxID=2053044 RepID=UPI0021558D6A|nr:G5 and 3D domain-containing protein [Bacillus sp. V5-8f]
MSLTLKNLNPMSFGKKRLAIALSGTAAAAVAMGLMFYHGTKQTVELNLDGQKQVVRTHAATIDDIFKELKIRVKSEDYLYPSGNSKVKDDLKVVWEPSHKMWITENGTEKQVASTVDTVEELLKEQRLNLTGYDKVTPSLDTKLHSKIKISIERAFPLKLVVGGNHRQVWSTSTTVADFLRQQGVKLNKLDRVEPGLGEDVKAGIAINVIRVEKVTDVVEEPVEFEVITKKDSSLVKGKEKLISAGKNGLVSRQYTVVKENGKEINRQLLSETMIERKEDKVVAIGTKSLATNVLLGEKGGRELFVSSTAYTAGCNGCSGITATGINLRSNPGAKIIAVDPGVIPLGSKVFVEGYGYAIAGDTGGAIKGHKIDVFFSSTSQAYRWGRKKVKITVMD